MSELRQDMTTGDWVVFAAERAMRPHDRPFSAGTFDGEPSRDLSCPFCPGNEVMTPPELERSPRDARTPWRLRVVPNFFAAFSSDVPFAQTQTDDGFRRMAARGAHEVVIETPDHGREVADLADVEVARVLRAYQSRYRAIRKIEGVRMISIFKNQGQTAGASLRHAHSQILGVPVMTPTAVRRLEVARAHYERTGVCVYCDLRDRERMHGERVVFEDGGAVAIHPYASRSPYETWIMPLSHSESFEAATEIELESMARAARRALRGLREILGDVGLNYIVQTAPVREGPRADFLWYIQIVPRLGVAAGFELASGTAINTAYPEETAAVLRASAAVRSGP